MKCPVCGGTKERKYAFSGDLYQTTDPRCICTKGGYGGPADEEIFAEVVRKIQREMEKKGDG